MKTNKIPLRQYIAVLGITIAAFIFNISEFMPIGLLSDIASNFQQTEAETGIMITAYAWVVAVLSLPLMLMVTKMELKKLLIATITLFCIGQIVSGSAVNFIMLLAGRICVACAHSIFWSIAAPIAVQLVSKEHRSMALSIVATGTSVAMIFGLPLGRMIGLYLGWRMTFMMIAGTAFLTMVYLFFVFPRLTNQSTFSIDELPNLLKNPVLISIYVLTALTATVYYTGYSYIEPFLSQVAHISDHWITMILAILGVSGLLGSFLFSTFYDQYRFRFIRFSFTALAIALLLLQTAAVNFYAMIALCILWGIASMSFNITLQSEVMQCVPIRANAVAMSMYSGIFNLGIGSGTWFGGYVTTHYTIGDIGYAGGGIAVIAVIYCLFQVITKVKRREHIHTT